MRRSSVPAWVKANGLSTRYFNAVASIFGPFGGQGVSTIFNENNNTIFIDALNETRGVHGTAADDIDPMQRIYLKDTVTTFDFVNVYNVPCVLTWYILKTRVDLISGDPLLFWNQGYTENRQSGLPGIGRYRATPFESTPFTRHFKVVSVKKYKMDTGAQKSLKFKRRLNRIFERSDNTPTTLSSRYTYSHMLVVTGCVDRQATVAVPLGQPGISAAQVDVVITHKLDYYPIQTTFRNNAVVNQLINGALSSETAVDKLGYGRVPFPVDSTAFTGKANNIHAVLTKEIPP